MFDASNSFFMFLMGGGFGSLYIWYRKNQRLIEIHDEYILKSKELKQLQLELRNLKADLDNYQTVHYEALHTNKFIIIQDYNYVVDILLNLTLYSGLLVILLIITIIFVLIRQYFWLK